MRGEIGLIVLNSAEKIGTRVDQILSGWRDGKHFLIPAECPPIQQRGREMPVEGVCTGP